MQEKGKRIEFLKALSYRESSERITPFVHEDFARAQKSESFKDSGENIRRDSIFIRARETQCYRVRRGKKEKVEAFDNRKFFQVREESAKSQEEQQLLSNQPRRSRPWIRVQAA
jgi:hypothetical protein